jgi:hypothetical protein
MRDPFHEQEHHWIAYGDFLTTLLGLFLICTVLLIPFINRKTLDNDGAGNTNSPGNISVEIVWHEDEVDVDTWVQAPGDVIVGYSNKAGKVFNLLRDDLGQPYEKVGGLHHENVYSRNMPQGEYVVNIHMFNNSIGKWPIEVEVNVSIVKNSQDSKSENRKVIKTTLNLEKSDQELTAVRFRLDDKGNVVDGSINNQYKPLRSAR